MDGQKEGVRVPGMSWRRASDHLRVRPTVQATMKLRYWARQVESETRLPPVSSLRQE